MAQITSREELEAWLIDKPIDWGQIIAVRAALRVLPYALHERTTNIWVSTYAIDLFRGTAISLITINHPNQNMINSAVSATQSVLLPANIATEQLNKAVKNVGTAYSEQPAFLAIKAYSLMAVANSLIGVSRRDIGLIGKAVNASINSLTMHAAALVYAKNSSDSEYIAAEEAVAAATSAWLIVKQDCDLLAKDGIPAIASRLRARDYLWPSVVTHDRKAVWDYAARRLISLDPSYQVWIDWYNRRIEGHDAAFDIPGDSDRTEDKAILARLADATDEDFWGKGAAHVNTTLQGWIDEARERVRPRDAPFVTDPLRQIEAAPEPIPPQNQNAIPFTATESGKIRIDQSRNADALRTDGDAQDRHAEAIREARALLDRCRLSNSAARFVSGFENYLAAGGETLADLRPSLFVQRGEKLRQEIAAYEGSEQDSFLEPIADDLLIDLKGWRSAHNMAVGLDPVLMRIDTAMLGPDVKPTLIAPSELHAFVADADEADILDDGVREIVDEAIDLAPDVPDPNDRRTVWSVESVQNLVIEAFSVALDHPVKVAVGVGFTAAVGVKVAAGVVGGALVSAKFLIKHRTWIETRLNNTPTWQSLFNQICDRLEEWTPFKSSKDDDGV